MAPENCLDQGSGQCETIKGRMAMMIFCGFEQFCGGAADGAAAVPFVSAGIINTYSLSLDHPIVDQKLVLHKP